MTRPWRVASGVHERLDVQEFAALRDALRRVVATAAAPPPLRAAAPTAHVQLVN